MKKIEEAAYAMWPDPHDTANGNCRYGFILGARYVLDAMIHEESARLFVEASIMKAGTDWAKANAVLSAVRKEIEGE